MCYSYITFSYFVKKHKDNHFLHSEGLLFQSRKTNNFVITSRFTLEAEKDEQPKIFHLLYSQCVLVFICNKPTAAFRLVHVFRYV